MSNGHCYVRKKLQDNMQLFCDNLYLLASKTKNTTHVHLQVKLTITIWNKCGYCFYSTSKTFFFFSFRFLIFTEHLLKCPELVKALYAKLSNQER